MNFELNEYHRNVSDEELIEDVITTAKAYNKHSLTRDEYSSHGKYHASTLTRRFGSWKNVLELCNLETKGHIYKCVFSDDDIIADLKRVAKELGVTTLTSTEYNAHGTYHSTTLRKQYGSWNKVLELAGMKINLNRNFTDQELFEEIERVWILLGRQPTTTDIKKGISKYSLQSYARRFGGWRGALQEFVNYINDDSISENIENFTKPSSNTHLMQSNNASTHKTNRDINLRLRFKVMQRDHFKCCACGSSPAKDSSVELHIDHIIPWSRGGETVIENLQTLCSKCNLGKGDLL